MGMIQSFTAERYESRVYLQRAIYHLCKKIREMRYYLEYRECDLDGDLDAINLLAIRLRNTL